MPAPCKCSEAKLEDIGTVYKISCTDQKLQSILDISALKSVALPIHLTLNENEIKSVAMSDFSPGLPIQSLDLSSNKDIRIADAAFDNISPTLTKLTLGAISLTLDSPLTMVSSLSGLREFSISHNNRKGYVSGAVENVSSVLFTDPWPDEPVRCPDAHMSQLNNLQTLTLEKAGIKTLPPSAMCGIKAKTISLAENDLTTIEAGRLPGTSARSRAELEEDENFRHRLPPRLRPGRHCPGKSGPN
ncbi:hypothetical protein Btru_015190 [Bulinus truncatus]|nr:hypothetical protein Btru_015190 [Bulinus truncatus]